MFTFKIMMQQTLWDVGYFEAETEEEALEMARETLDPVDIEHNEYPVLEVQ